MSNLFEITIPDNPYTLLSTYGAGALIRVQSAATSGGSYADITNPTLAIVSGTTVYAVYDPDGVSTDFYQYRYEAADGDPAGDYSDPFQPMPLSTVYASLARFKAFLRQSDTADDDLLGLALVAASRAIDRACGRTFNLATGTATARRFTPTAIPGYSPIEFTSPIYPYAMSRYPYSWFRHYILDVDDFTSSDAISTIKFDATGNGDYTNTTTAFRIGPYNAPTIGMPYHRVIFDSGIFPPLYEESVEVTADWGWDAVPDTIVNACLIQAGRFIKRRDSLFGVAGSPEMGNEMRLLSKVDPDVAVMIAAYKKNWAVV